jgi:hypothetical protein
MGDEKPSHFGGRGGFEVPAEAPAPAEPCEGAFDDRVRIEITDQLRYSRAVALVCSAACGADLIALDSAQQMGLRTRIILASSAARFRETSVVDRPRPEFWGCIFDRVVSVAGSQGDLVERNLTEDNAYSIANTIVIDEARNLAGVNVHGRSRESLSLIALIVWEGASRGAKDNSDEFVELARHSGFQIEQILTLCGATEISGR